MKNPTDRKYSCGVEWRVKECFMQRFTVKTVWLSLPFLSALRIVPLSRIAFIEVACALSNIFLYESKHKFKAGKIAFLQCFLKTLFVFFCLWFRSFLLFSPLHISWWTFLLVFLTGRRNCELNNGNKFCIICAYKLQSFPSWFLNAIATAVDATVKMEMCEDKRNSV